MIDIEIDFWVVWFLGVVKHYIYFWVVWFLGVVKHYIYFWVVWFLGVVKHYIDFWVVWFLGVVNLSRVEVFWRPITNHLLEVCQHPHIRMREWGVEAVTYLVRTALTHPQLTHPPQGSKSPPLRDNQKLQSLLLSPLSELSGCGHADVRQKQLESLLAVLHSCGEQMQHGWPTILTVIAAVNDNHR